MSIEEDTKVLVDLSKIHSTDKSIHGFLPLYAKYIKNREEHKKVLEIGIKTGSSLRIWKEYFPNAKIFGIDISNNCMIYNEERIFTFIVDQKNRLNLKRLIDIIGSDLNLIIDDGSHRMLDQQVSLGFLFRHLAPKGLYVIEDLNTSNNPKFGLPKGHPQTTLNVLERFNIGRDLYTNYITQKEAIHFESHVRQCKIHSLRDGKNIIAFIRKRARRKIEESFDV